MQKKQVIKRLLTYYTEYILYGIHTLAKNIKHLNTNFPLFTKIHYYLLYHVATYSQLPLQSANIKCIISRKHKQTPENTEHIFRKLTK